MPSPSSPSIEDTLILLDEIRLLARPLRIHRARLLRIFRDLGAAQILGFEHTRDFTRHCFHLSHRSLRRLLCEASLFEDYPELEEAFLCGRLGMGKVLLLRRLPPGSLLPKHLARAERITHRQLEREIRFLDKLHQLAGPLRLACPGPLPAPQLEDQLRLRLHTLGWSPEKIETELARRGLSLPGLTQPGLSHPNLAPTAPPSPEPGQHSRVFYRNSAFDPALNPLILRRLETLLDLLLLASCDDSLQLPNSVAPSARLSLSPEGPRTRISFWTPDTALQDWYRFRRNLTPRFGPLPDWCALTLLLREATEEWLRHDPQRRPTMRKILERDEYRCQFPGCTSRCRLEAHDILFRSQGGKRRPSNLVMLCHYHHQQAIHQGRVRLKGRAPDRLHWQIGLRFQSPDLRRRYDGDLLRRRGDP